MESASPDLVLVVGGGVVVAIVTIAIAYLKWHKTPASDDDEAGTKR